MRVPRGLPVVRDREADGTAVLLVEDLKVYYHTAAGPVKAVDGVGFGLAAGERFGLVGESGSGKSTIALALMRLIRPPGQIEDGAVLLGDTNLLDLSEEQMRRMRLAEISLVAQGAMNSLNPVKRIKDQILLGLRDHGVRLSDAEAASHIADLLQRVGLKSGVAKMFPHELSGGMKQRVCIAIAISLQPKVIVADEPTSALDVVVQWQVIDTLKRVQEELGAAVILIGHDMGLMAQAVDRLGVMYAGKLVEVVATRELFGEPLHPYTQLLIASLPSLEGKSDLRGIPGLPPSLLHRPAGCPFHTRCPFVMNQCRVEEPTLIEHRPGHWAACHLYGSEVSA
ncbi:MAG: ABC transporter ATP-binding protein [Chloroflexia bacterium]|nr:ABC transporter ATP-binding protein [Chloroflexia bacterium]